MPVLGGQSGYRGEMPVPWPRGHRGERCRFLGSKGAGASEAGPWSNLGTGARDAGPVAVRAPERGMPVPWQRGHRSERCRSLGYAEGAGASDAGPL